ncbi:MAG TPA: MBL fold metallo-hydrolase [Baekduia sp.]|uniref:MBL fold metallo-hydrolase n=1 Tax=Baekduia sp. TaxID=2600305 RepID=UPI002D76E777|nr:MBL fold metallo-hydrolase [Baekduia sp.]HET6507865.1 MBL fold metallo-hydrolase [Baekduia sp.]
MSTEIRFLGVAGFEIVGGGRRILIDPFLSASPAAPVRHEDLATPDVILVSHAAFDHLGDTAAIALRTGAPVVCGADVRIALLAEGVPSEQVRATVWGLVVELDGLLIRPVECHHWSMATLPDGSTVTGTPIAFIVEPEPGVRIYHYGDTAIFDMRWIGELYRPTIGLIGCSQPRELLAGVPGPGRLVTGELSPDEAGRVAEMLGVELAVACHYLERNDDVDAFVAAVAQHDSTGTRRVATPRVGEVVVVEPSPVAGSAA